MKGQQTNHTPGLWNVALSILGTNEYAYQPDPEHEPDHWRCVVEGLEYSIAIVAGTSKEQAISNARLIAAGPELLAACQRLLAYDATVPDRPSGQIADGQKLVDAIKLAMAAVAKATQS